jgi:signal transduction histidine kinase
MLAVIGKLTGLDRVYVMRYEHETAAGFCEAEWCREGIPTIHETVTSGPYPFADYREVWEPLMGGRHYTSVVEEKVGANRELNINAKNQSDLFVPIFVDDVFWGSVGFDDCTTPRRYSEAEIQVLRGVAAAIAAALARDRAQAAQRAVEDRHNAVLGAVSEVARLLVEQVRWTDVLPEVLATLYRATGVDRVFINRYEESTRSTYFLEEHKRPDLPRMPDYFGPGPWQDEAFPEVSEPLKQGRVYRSVAVQRSGANGAANRAGGVLSDLIVPILPEGRYWGCIGFDDCTVARVWNDADIAVLQTAANVIAAAIAREGAETRRLREAEAYAARTQRHSALLRAVATSTEELLEAACPTLCLDAVLERIGTIGRAMRACVARFDWTREDPDVHGHQEIIHEWTAAGVVRQMDSPTRRFAMLRKDPTWETSLALFRERGRLLVVIAESEEPFRSEQSALGVEWTLGYPIVVEGDFWGVLGLDYATSPKDYDEADLAALQTLASAIAAALVRERSGTRALAVERARVDETRALNQLLENVVAASRALLEEPSFEAGLASWLEQLARAVNADHAVLGEFPGAVAAGTVSPIFATWSRSGITPPSGAIPETTDFVRWRERLLQGDFIWAHRDELSDPTSVRFWESVDCFTDLIVPIIVDRRTVGWLSFDWSNKREWNPAFIAILRTAADGMASAFKRNEALRGMLAEREARLTLERERADLLQSSNLELRRRDSLLTAAAEALKGLMTANDLAVEVRNALRILGEAADMQRVKVLLQRKPPDGPEFHELVYEWWSPELVSQTELGVTHFPDDLVVEYLASLRAGQSLWKLIDEVLPHLREPFQRVGMQSMGAVPIFAQSTYVGLVAFDDCRRRRVWSQAEKEALTIAARGLGAAIRRERMEAEKIEAVSYERTLAAKTRANEVVRANGAMRRTLAELARSQNVEGFFRIALQEIVRLAGACAAHLFDYDAASNRLRQLCVVRDGEFYADGHPEDPPSFRAGFDADVTPAFREMASNPAEPWSTDSVDGDTVWPDTRGWHRRMGHRALSGRALMAGERPIGLLGLAYREANPLSQTETEVMEALSQQLALAMQLTRLGDQARQQQTKAAVQGERNRLAREIHDTLAQSFTSILLQLEAASLLRERGDPRADERYRNIRAQAQLGLAETRRTALALSSEALNRGLLPALIQLCQRSHVEDRMSCSVTHRGLPRRLEAEQEESLLRLAKEALSNAVRHGRASVVKMKLVFAPAEVRLTIADNGRGFPTAQPREGLGLSNMRAGLARLGGTLEIRSRPSLGTTLVAVVPI